MNFYWAYSVTLHLTYSASQRRRNRGGNGGTRPRNAPTAGRKYLIAPQ